MEDGFRMILEGMGEDPNREGLIDTPKRVAKMYAELMTSLTGEMKAEDILKTRFHEKYDEMIIVPDIEFASMCEHRVCEHVRTPLLAVYGQGSRGLHSG